MQVLADFLTSWYGVAVALGAALSLFWGIAKAVGALRSWLHKRYTERQETPGTAGVPEKAAGCHSGPADGAGGAE